MSRTKPCHRPSGRILALTSTGDEAAVLAAECPLDNLDGAARSCSLSCQSRSTSSGGSRSTMVFPMISSRGSRAGAARVVHVGVAAVDVRHEDSIRCLLDEIPGLRAARLDGFVHAVEGHGGDAEQEQTHHGHRGRQDRDRNGELPRYPALRRIASRRGRAARGPRPPAGPGVSVGCHPDRARSPRA